MKKFKTAYWMFVNRKIGRLRYDKLTNALSFIIGIICIVGLIAFVTLFVYLFTNAMAEFIKAAR